MSQSIVPSVISYAIIYIERQVKAGVQKSQAMDALRGGSLTEEQIQQAAKFARTKNQ